MPIPPKGSHKGRMGLCVYAQILASITRKPQSAADICADFDRGPQRVRELLWRMTQLRLAHVSGWIRPAIDKGLWLPVFAGGDAPSVPYPRDRNAWSRAPQGSHLPTNDPRPELIAFAAVLRAMAEPASMEDIHSATGISKTHLRNLLRVLHAEGIAHTAGWERAPSEIGSPAQLHKFGAGRNVPRPAPKDRRTVSIEWRKRATARKRQLQAVRILAGHTYAPISEMQRVAA